MFRITPVPAVGTEIFRLEGSLQGEYVAELGRVLMPSLQGQRKVALDLRELAFVDAQGAELLKDLLSREVELQGCSGFVAQLLGLS
jgi:ABC-type transporter Mla MlaB component